jgi:hypothetical protein
MTALGATLAAALLAAPAMAQTTTTGNQAQNQGQNQGDREMSQAAQQCLEDLRQVDRQLAEVGYGRVGPEGYGTYGGAYQRRLGTAGTATTGAAGTGAMDVGLTSPRQDMSTLLRAGYIMAMTGHGEECQTVVQTAEQMGDRYRQALEEGDTQEAMREWRGEYLGSAIGVAEMEQPLRVDEILGADVRNMEDEDLGDIEDVVLGPDGKVQYVLIERGGFLGMGQEQVAVRWQDLKATPSPYRDTLILDVSEQTLEQAPTVEEDARTGLLDDEERRRSIDSFWDESLGERRG